MMIQLTPTQQRTCDELLSLLPLTNLLVLQGQKGFGKTTILQAVQQHTDAAFFQYKDFIDQLRDRHPLSLEETFEQIVMQALQKHHCVIVDDFDLLFNINFTCTGPRDGLIQVVLSLLTTYASQSGKKLIFSNAHGLSQAMYVPIPKFQPGDYQTLCQTYLPGEIAENLDYEKIFRFTSTLTGYQIRSACLRLQRDSTLIDTERFINFLRSYQLVSNINLQEVQAVNLHDLKGVDEVIRSLEANIILPLENDQLAQKLNLKPKRGVLLAGPPGTGKTTIGRALAHRLKSKFFLIDGTIIAGTGSFYNNIHEIFEYAKQNAPAIIFIDDGDVLFESGEELGLYRYLLTMLDGLESEGVGQVCLMMTAMNVSSLPPALVRSGRIELWLEMHLPDESARTEILKARMAQLPVELSNIDLAQLVEATEGFTGADLKRLLEDGKTLYAYDLARQVLLRSPTEYFLAAVETVRSNKARYAEAEAIARQQGRQQPNHASTMAMFNVLDQFHQTGFDVGAETAG